MTLAVAQVVDRSANAESVDGEVEKSPDILMGNRVGLTRVIPTESATHPPT